MTEDMKRGFADAITMKLRFGRIPKAHLQMVRRILASPEESYAEKSFAQGFLQGATGRERAARQCVQITANTN